MRIPQPENRAKVVVEKQPATDRPGAKFQYVGKTAMTALGLGSGLQYRFSHPGAILEVDWRDKASLAAVPNLRQI
jgi:hypothetical protein